MKPEIVSLCFPDQEKSCFGCCPPIRPPGYEHIQYKNITKRILRENVKNFNHERMVIPITGFSCWALGYLDKNCKLIGCMLHPAQNSGEDLRFRVDYGEKCHRERCYEERIFSHLDYTHQDFWLRLTKGLDSFTYSSREENPLFKMINWGTHLLNIIATYECGSLFTGESFFRSYRFFTGGLSPRPTAYLLNRSVTGENIDILKSSSFALDLKALQNHIRVLVAERLAYLNTGPYVHLLEIDPLFSDYLRLGLNISRMDLEGVLKLKKIVDKELEKFKIKNNI